jgi:hypothetical protein
MERLRRCEKVHPLKNQITGSVVLQSHPDVMGKRNAMPVLVAWCAFKHMKILSDAKNLQESVLSRLVTSALYRMICHRSTVVTTGTETKSPKGTVRAHPIFVAIILLILATATRAPSSKTGTVAPASIKRWYQVKRPIHKAHHVSSR